MMVQSTKNSISRNNQPVNWKEPVPLADSSLPAFPVECLPPVLRNYAPAVSESTQTPVDMAAVKILAVLASCIQGKYVIQGKADWIEQLCLYILLILFSAERKSAIDNHTTFPLLEYERIANERDREAIARSKIERKMLEKAVDVLIAQATKDKARQNELFAKQDELSSFAEKKSLRLYCDDVTPEALISLMAENGGKMAVISSEGGIFDILNGRYSNSINIDAFLKAHSGDPIRVDRRGREPEYIQNPCLSVALSIQPQVLDEIMGNPSFAGRGLLARFLYSVPKSKIGSRQFESKPIPEELRAQYRELIFDILELEQPEKPHVLKLSPEAYALTVKFANALEPRLLDDLHSLGSWAGKLHGVVLRIAGLLHVAEQLVFAANTPISGATMEAAIQIGGYFTKHAKHAYSLLGIDKTVKEARYILTKIEKHRFERFTKTEIMRVCRRYRKVDEIDAPLSVLVEHGYLCIADTQIAANKTKVDFYAVNPLFLQLTS